MHGSLQIGNGCESNGFSTTQSVGKINVQRGTTTDLTFSLVNGTGVPVVAPALHFTIMVSSR